MSHHSLPPRHTWLLRSICSFSFDSLHCAHREDCEGPAEGQQPGDAEQAVDDSAEAVEDGVDQAADAAQKGFDQIC